MVVISAFVVLVSFFGCCGAWKESKCMLGTYFTFVLLLFILLLTGGILAYSGDLKNSIRTPLLKSDVYITINILTMYLFSSGLSHSQEI